MDKNTSIIKNVRREIQEKKITMVDLARAIGVNVHRLANILCRGRRMSASELLAIAQALNVSAEDLGK